LEINFVIHRHNKLLIGNWKYLNRFLEPDPHALLGDVCNESAWGRKHQRLSEAIGNLVEDFSLVRFIPLNIDDEENIADVLLTIDGIIQYGEDLTRQKMMEMAQIT
jgi:GPN-loop GTPase